MIITPHDNCAQYVEKTTTSAWHRWANDVIKPLALNPASWSIIHTVLGEQIGSALISRTLPLLNQLYGQDLDWINSKSGWLFEHFHTLNHQLNLMGLYHPKAVAHLVAQSTIPSHLVVESAWGLEYADNAQRAALNSHGILDITSPKICEEHLHQVFVSFDHEVESALAWQAAAPDRHIVCANQSAYQSAITRALSFGTQDQAISVHALLDLFSPEGLVPQDVYLSLKRYEKHTAHSEYRHDLHQPHAVSVPAGEISFDQFKSSLLNQLSSWRLRQGANCDLETLNLMLKDLSMCQLLYTQKPYTDWYRQLKQLVTHYTSSPSFGNISQLMGQRVSGIWVLGYSQLALTPKAPDPLLQEPPNASLVWDGLFQLAPNVVTSFTAYDDNGNSNILPKGIKPTEIISNAYAPDMINIQRIDDCYGNTTENVPISASKIQDYAQCPFRAFARYRLKLQSLNLMGLEPQASDMGNLVHDILETLYGPIKTQSDLAQISNEEIAHTIEKIWLKHEIETHPNLTLILKESLHALISDWLEHELERPAFSVDALETKYQIQHEDITINMRLDRIDYQDNQAVLIDYKTGLNSINEALNPAFTSPQLPLYALSQDHAPQIAYALIRKDIGYHALDLADEHAIEQVQKRRGYPEADFETLKNQWLDSALAITQDFYAGVFPAKPANPLVCQRCDFASLCRRHLQGESS